MADPGCVLAPGIAAQTEEEFVQHGFRQMLEDMRTKAEQDPNSPPAPHLGITASASPQAIHRVSMSVVGGPEPPIRRLLQTLPMPRHYLGGANSDQALPPQPDLVAAGVVWRTVPDTGHATALLNPLAFAEAVAAVVPAGAATRS